MKKFVIMLLSVALMFVIAACSGEPGEEAAAQTEAEDTVEVIEAEPVSEVKERDLAEGDYAEMGEGTVYIATAGGTSEDGNIPVIYAETGLALKQIGLNAWDFNGGALSFIYVDGMEVSKEQLANTQTVLTLEGDLLSVGIHTVEVVQYENDDPTSAMITYKSMQYEIKAA